MADSATGTAGGAAPPRIAVLFLLPDCNLACPFCVSETDFDVLGPQAARRLVVGLAAVGVRGLVLGGGEPLLWPHDLEELTGWAARCGLEVQVATNGIALRKGFETAAGVARYVLPLDAADPAIHDGLRRPAQPRGDAPSHHALVLSRWDALARAGREVTLSTLVVPQTAGDLLPLAQLVAARHAAGARVHSWHLYRFVAEGRGGRSNAPRFALDPGSFRAALQELRALGLPFPPYGRLDPYASRRIAFVWSQGGRLMTPRGPLAALPWWGAGAAAAEAR